MAPVANECVWTIIVAAGSGSRFGGPKQFIPLGERRVLDWSRETAALVSAGVVVVLPAEHADAEGGVPGGTTRSESVRRGLAAVPAEATIICVHDAARPFASKHLFSEVVAHVAAGADGAIPALPVVDTIKQVDDRNEVVSTPDRSRLVAVQTPQAFRAGVLRRAHADHGDGTDDSALVEAVGGKVVVVPGETLNRKLTTPEDMEWARATVLTEI